MDTTKALEAVEVAVGAIRATVPEAEQPNFDAELAALYGAVSEAAGAVAVAETLVTPEILETELEKQLPDFLNPEIKLGMNDQLAVMQEFWQELGYEVPELNTEQQAHLERAIAAHPDRRVIPTPLLDVTARQQISESARVAFAKNSLNPRTRALYVPSTLYTYGKCLDDPEVTVNDGGTSYGLFYKTPLGDVVKRSAYIATLKQNGQAIEVEDGTTWVFPVMDAQVRAPRKHEYVSELYAQVSSTSTPESHIAMQLLHQANGAPPNRAWESDIVNEAVYELDKKGNPVALKSAASVGLDPRGNQVDLDFQHDRSIASGRFGVRAEESGLAA